MTFPIASSQPSSPCSREGPLSPAARDIIVSTLLYCFYCFVYPSLEFHLVRPIRSTPLRPSSLNVNPKIVTKSKTNPFLHLVASFNFIRFRLVLNFVTAFYFQVYTLREPFSSVHRTPYFTTLSTLYGHCKLFYIYTCFKLSVRHEFTRFLGRNHVGRVSHTEA